MIPATGRKNEYHKRVSPIVRSGGRSNDIHMPTMKAMNIASPATVHPITRPGLSVRYAIAAPIAQQMTDGKAKYIK